MYANQNSKYTKQKTKYAKQNTKYANQKHHVGRQVMYLIPGQTFLTAREKEQHIIWL